MKPLSPNNNELRIVTPSILACLALFLATILLRHHLLLLFSGVFIVGGFSFVYLLKVYNRTENIFYDTEFLFLKNKYQTRKIKLQKVTAIKRTTSKKRIIGVQYYEYQIDFIDEYNLKDSVTIWLNGLHDRLSAFEKQLDYYAPNTKIEHPTSTLYRY